MTTALINVTTASTAELVAFYNASVAADKQIKKFADRKTAECRCLALMLGVEVVDAPVIGEFTNCPSCGVHLSNGYGIDGDEVNGKARRLAHEFECLGCGATFGAATGYTGIKNVARSAGIAKSWQDAEVAAKRAERTAVSITSADGTVAFYKSVRTAFRALALPLNQHIAFRMELKAAGTVRCYDYTWAVVPR